LADMMIFALKMRRISSWLKQCTAINGNCNLTGDMSVLNSLMYCTPQINTLPNTSSLSLNSLTSMWARTITKTGFRSSMPSLSEPPTWSSIVSTPLGEAAFSRNLAKMSQIKT
jgi:hypothetical protein